MSRPALYRGTPAVPRECGSFQDSVSPCSYDLLHDELEEEQGAGLLAPVTTGGGVASTDAAPVAAIPAPAAVAPEIDPGDGGGAAVEEEAGGGEEG